MKKLLGFLGKVNYYRRFIKDYTAIAFPLLEYLKAEGPMSS